MSDLLGAWALARREVVRFVRQPSRVAGALGSPLVFWALIGTGLSSSFRVPGAPPSLDFRAYFFPGTMVLVVLFAAIFSTLSVIEDRDHGFLQGVLAAPISRPALVAGKVLGGATLAWLQGALLLALAPAAGLPLSAGGAAAAAGVLALLAVALTAVGLGFAWRSASVQGFHAVMNLLLVPLWLLSGALFPLAGAPAWLGGLMRANPLTYGVAALRHALGSSLPGLPPMAPALAVTALLAAGGFAFALAATRARGGSP
jgi:daunorubicin resistance ABC transporter membrane protein